MYGIVNDNYYYYKIRKIPRTPFGIEQASPSPHWIANFMRAGTSLFKTHSTVLCTYQPLQRNLLKEWINEYNTAKGCLMISVTKYLTLRSS